MVPRQGADDPAYEWPYVKMPGVGPADNPYVDDRDHAERQIADVADPEVTALRSKLYEREVWGRYRRGDVLLYRHDCWHRGTPINQGACCLGGWARSSIARSQSPLRCPGGARRALTSRPS